MLSNHEERLVPSTTPDPISNPGVKKIQNTDDINTFNENQTLHDTPYTLFHGSLLYSVLIHITIRTAGL